MKADAHKAELAKQRTMRESSVTTIAAAWRGYNLQMLYQQIIGSKISFVYMLNY